VVWGAAVVEVDLDAESNEFPLAGEVRNHGTEVLRVAFSPEKGASDDAVVARISGTGEPVSLRAGESFDLFPPGGEGPSWRRFALRPDESWPESKLPHLGATVSYVAIVQASTGETRVPLRFRVVTAYRNIAGWGEPQWDRLPCFMHPWFGRDPEPEKTQ
jgi:hypothetical protein